MRKFSRFVKPQQENNISFFNFNISSGILPPIFTVVIMKMGLFYATMGRDAGTFAYTGVQILKGSIPYRDVWDHKPPIVFYLNALAMYLGGERPVSLRIFEITYSIITVIVFFRLSRKFLGENLAILTTTMFAVMSSVYGVNVNGNLTETYMLLPIILGIFFVYQAIDQEKIWYFVLFGISFGVAVLIKQTAIVDFLSVLLVTILLYSIKLEQRFKQIVFSFIGLFIPLIFAHLYFLSRGALFEYYEAAWLYNFSYVSGKQIQSRDIGIYSILGAIRYALLWLHPIFVGGGLAILFRIKGWLSKIEKVDILFAWVFGSIIAVAIGFQFRNHYWLQTVPAFTLLSGITVQFFNQRILAINHVLQNKVGLLAITFIIMAIPLAGQSYWFVDKIERHFTQRETIAEETATFLNSVMTEFNTLFVWGAEPEIYYLTNQTAPTRYVYKYPLLGQDARTIERRDELVADLRQSLPDYFVLLDVPPFGIGGNVDDELAGFPQVLEMLQSHYQLCYSLRNQTVRIYLEKNMRCDVSEK